MNSNDDENPESIVKQQHSYVIRDFIVMVVIVVGVAIWSSVSGNDDVGLQLGDNFVTIVCPDEDKTEFTMNFSDVTSMELVNVSDFGINISGGENRNVRYGVWENEKWGNYELYALTSFNECIVMHSADAVLVFNTESDEVTADLFTQIQEIL